MHSQFLESEQAVEDIRHTEFRAFSQFGEDGIIQYLLHSVGPVPRRFVEFGVEDYREASTRLLAELGGWQGLVMDGSRRNIMRFRRSSVAWRLDVCAVTAFVTAENIDDLISEHGLAGEIGVLVIDIDGNDYWVWKAISCCSPAIVVIEYNALFGLNRSVTIPYDPRFSRYRAHPSGLYAGASLRALCQLGAHKGYRFVGVNSQANNAFFVREDLSSMQPASLDESMTRPGFRQARDSRGSLTYEGDLKALRRVLHLPVLDLETGATVPFGELVLTD